MGISTLPLTIGNLEVAIAEMKGSNGATQGYLDCHGEPILNDPKYLVVPPALQLQAERILRSTSIAWTSGAGGGAVMRGTVTALADYALELIVDPWIPIVDTTSGTTTWALFSENIKPGVYAELRGHQAPEIWMKAPDAVKLGGGAVNPFEGDFATDNIFYRARYCADAIQLEPRGGWASSGTGSVS